MNTIVRLASTVLLVVSVVSGTAHAQDYPKSVGYVNDFAHVFSVVQTQALTTELNDFETRTTNVLVIVTVPSLQGYSVELYTLGLAKAWGVGKKDKNNGVVLLVAPS